MKKQIKIARGYRLLPQTHKKITKIQKLLDSDSEKAISTACLFFLKHHEGLNPGGALKSKAKTILKTFK